MVMVFKGLMSMYQFLGVLAVKFVRLFKVARQIPMKTLAFSDSLLGNAKREWLCAKCITLKSLIMPLKVKIINNRNKDEYFGDLFKDGVFPPSAYRHMIEQIQGHYKIGIKLTIIVNPDVIEGTIF